MAVVWTVMMAVWLAALIFGAWWMWPRFETRELGGDLVAGIVWLVIGTAAWIVALRLGLARYTGRGRRSE